MQGWEPTKVKRVHIYSAVKYSLTEMSFEVEQRTPATASIGSQLNLFMEKKNYKDHRKMLTTFSLILDHNLNALTAETERR